MARPWAVGAAATLALACTALTSPNPSSAPSAAAPIALPGQSARPSPTVTALPLTFHASAGQARMIATFIAFLDAYNAGRVQDALSLFSAYGGVSDCDYRAVRVITTTGTDATREWLHDRIADHDRLVLESIKNENPDPAGGSHVVGVTFGRRTSDTLRSLGFPSGIAPELAAKVVFTETDDHIRAFANGPFGGPAELCRPSP